MQRFECMKDILKFFLTLFKILNTFRILLHLRHLRQNNCDTVDTAGRHKSGLKTQEIRFFP